MTISWFGLSSFKIVGKDITIITDPFGKDTGLSAVRGGADVVISSNIHSPWANNTSSITQNPFLIAGPGEYEIKGAFVIGAPADEKEMEGSTVYLIQLEDIRIAFLGLVNQPQLSDKQKDILKGTDIVLVPVGGKTVLDFEAAGKIATQLEPFIVIPHTYKIPGVTANLDSLDKFLKEMGGKSQEMEKLTLKKKDLSGESTETVVLTALR